MPPAEDDTEVLGVPCEEHLQLLTMLALQLADGGANGVAYVHLATAHIRTACHIAMSHGTVIHH